MKYIIFGIGALIVIIIVLLSLPRAAILQESPKYAATRDSISKIELACQQYKKDFSTNPPFDARALTSALTGNNSKNIIYLSPQDVPIKNGEFVDPWHTPFQHSQNDSYDFIFRSAGRDGKFHTNDDCVNE